MPTIGEMIQQPQPQGQGQTLASLLPNPNDPSWKRADGSQKGMGFLGPLKFHDGRTSSELSVGVNIDGKEMEIPSLVPTLTPQEIAHLLRGGAPSDGIVQKAVDHAKMRLGQNLSVFATAADKPAPIDLATGMPLTPQTMRGNVIDPNAMGGIPMHDYSGANFGPVGTRNEGIYPVRR